MQTFETPKLDTIYSSGKELLVDPKNRSSHFKRIGNEDLISGTNGKVINPELATSDIFWQTGLAFEPLQVDVKAVYGSNGIDCPKHKAIINNRNGAVLNVTNKTYTPLNNEIMQNCINANRDILDIEHVTSINNGARCFVSCAIKDSDQDVGNDDKIRRRLIFINSFDGSYSFKLVLIDFRLFCFNQMGRINNSKSKLVFKHTKNIIDYAKHLPEFIAYQKEDLIKSTEELKAMKNTYCNWENLREIFLESFADKLTGFTKDKDTGEKRAKSIIDIEKEYTAVKNQFNKYDELNLYSALNAITYQQTHLESRTKDDIQAARVRFESLLSGKCGMRIDKAREKCLSLTR